MENKKSVLPSIVLGVWFVGLMLYVKSLLKPIPKWVFWLLVVVTGILVLWFLISSKK
jgi:fatty acid desaturase